MLRTDARIGQKVYFGRTNGEKTLGEIIKLNPKKAKVRTLEDRGRVHIAGEVWGVPYSLMTLADSSAKSAPGGPAPRKKLEYNRFDHINNLILEAIVAVYSDLSPENLSGDGELPMTQVRHRKSVLDRQLRGLLTAYGQPVDELEAYDWAESKRLAH
jgi:hypothetical protein